MTNFLDNISNQDLFKKVHHPKLKELIPIQDFITENDIKVGPDAVPMRFIYALYCDQLRMPIPQKRFTQYFKNFFKRLESSPYKFYRLDKTPFNLPEGYTLWKEKNLYKFKYQTTKYKNIKSTPEGWMIYLDLAENNRKIFGFDKVEIRAAKLADRAAWFYFGPTYNKFNFKHLVAGFKEDESLRKLLIYKKDAKDDNSNQKESL